MSYDSASARHPHAAAAAWPGHAEGLPQAADGGETRQQRLAALIAQLDRTVAVEGLPVPTLQPSSAVGHGLIPAGHAASNAHLPRARRPAARQRKRPVHTVLWAVAGFVAGAIFWHFIGFWGFVSEAVWHAARPERPASVRASATADPQKPLLYPARIARPHMGRAAARIVPDAIADAATDGKAGAAAGQFLQN